ncbi:MAG: FG-GAP-like repeat-containing protein, partial [Runella sp.]
TEVGQIAGVHATDWSWGALIFDMDNDGLKDLFVANGIVKDLTDQDYVAFLADEKNIQAMIEGRMKFNYRPFVDMIPSTPIPNFAFRNNGNLQFENKADAWGLGDPNFSNGAAYGDLDNDGDLDLVVNHNNAPLGVYRNHSVEKLNTHFLRVKLKGEEANPHAIGAKVYVYQKGQMQYLQQMPNRGFQSSSDLVLVFGLAQNPQIDSLVVIWPNDKKLTLQNPKADTELTLNLKNANQIWTYSAPKNNKSLIFKDITATSGFDFLHKENNFVDYNRDGLLKQMYSTQGPALAVGDVNADGLDDAYIGGGAGQPRALFLQTTNGKFVRSKQPAFDIPAPADETDALFFDADRDGDLDLYVVMGGNEFLQGNALLQDKLYINDGKGNFVEGGGLPQILENGSCVTADDYDRDGDLDLFVGTRMISGQYGYTPASYILQNDGKGHFRDVTKQVLPQPLLGMVTDAHWADLDKDGYPDLVVVGDWMPVRVFKNNKGQLLTANSTIPKSEGWWNRLELADLDNDGDLDFIVGNLGQNTKLKCSSDEPAMLYANDFDRSGTVDQVIVCYNPDGKAYPMVLKPDLQKVLPVIKKKFVKHTDYAGRPIEAIFTSEQMAGVQKKTVHESRSGVFINNGNWTFDFQPLPLEAQFSPVFGIVATDYNKDGKIDLMLAGNFYDVLPELGRYDGLRGLVLTNSGIESDGKIRFEVIPATQSGFVADGQTRRMAKARASNGKHFLILAKNKDQAQVFEF